MELVILGAFVGAVFATAGGFLQQRHQTTINQKRNDRNVLIKALDILLAMLKPGGVSLLKSDSWVKLSGSMQKSADKNYELASELYRLSFEFQRKESEDIADKIRHFALRQRLVGINELKEEIEERLKNQ
jgi:hypothetical protein